MAIRRTLALLALTSAISLIGVPAASAATEVGNACRAEAGFPAAATALQLAESTPNPLPLAVPAAGVISRWRVDALAGFSTVEEKLKVFRASGPGSFRVVAESAPQPMGSEENVAATRIPVQAGDRLGVYGTPYFLYCSGNPGDVTGVAAEDSPIGSSPTFAEILNPRLAVVATVEPDADGDGYGDETQDGCPQSAAYQAACPIVALRVRPVRKGKSLRLLVTADMGAEVTVYGQAMWGFKPKRKGLGKRTLIVPLYSGTKAVAAGQPTPFGIRYSKAVRRRLRKLTPKQSVRARITVTAPNPAGAPTTEIVKLRLHGWKRGRR